MIKINKEINKNLQPGLIVCIFSLYLKLYQDGDETLIWLFV